MMDYTSLMSTNRLGYILDLAEIKMNKKKKNSKIKTVEINDDKIINQLYEKNQGNLFFNEKGETTGGEGSLKSPPSIKKDNDIIKSNIYNKNVSNNNLIKDVDDMISINSSSNTTNSIKNVSLINESYKNIYSNNVIKNNNSDFFNKNIENNIDLMNITNQVNNINLCLNIKKEDNETNGEENDMSLKQNNLKHTHLNSRSDFSKECENTTESKNITMKLKKENFSNNSPDNLLDKPLDTLLNEPLDHFLGKPLNKFVDKPLDNMLENISGEVSDMSNISNNLSNVSDKIKVDTSEYKDEALFCNSPNDDTKVKKKKKKKDSDLDGYPKDQKNYTNCDDGDKNK